MKFAAAALVLLLSIVPCVCAQSGGDSQLFDAISQGDAARVQSLLQAGANIEARNLDDQTPLILAAAGGHTEIARLLLDRGANIEAGNLDGQTPLILAMFSGDAKIVPLLLERGANVEARESTGFTPLIRAAFEGEIEAAQLLLDHGVKVDAVDSEHMTALIYALIMNRPDMVRLLLAHRAGVLCRDKIVDSPLNAAVAEKNTEIVKLLLDAGADREAVGCADRNTPLVEAVRAGSAEIATILLNAGAQVSAADADGFTPLYWASQKDANPALKALLLSHGANPATANSNGKLALITAAEAGDIATVRSQLAAGAPVDLTNGIGETALMRAAAADKSDVVALLLDRGARIDIENRKGMTAFQLAIENLAVKSVAVLADHGADLEAPVKNGIAPLMEAVLRSLSDEKSGLAICRILLDHGAKPSPVSSDGFDPLLESVTGAIDPSMVALLVEHHADLNVRLNSGQTPLLEGILSSLRYGVKAAQADEILASFKLMLEHGADANAHDNEGITPLLAVVYCINSLSQSSSAKPDPATVEFAVATAKLLLDHGAAVYARDSDGDSVLSLARRQPGGDLLTLLQAASQRQLAELPSRPPQQQFDTYLGAFADSPQDDSLRTNLLRAAGQLPSPPVIPEEARQFAVEASQRMKVAASPADLDLSITLLRKAIDAAPWWADAYYNLAYALQAQSKFDQAIAQLNFYLASNPPAADQAKARARIKVLETERDAAH